jgi:hypothetical protein
MSRSAREAAAGDLSLRRVVLSSGGLGYFEYEATISGNAALRLEVRLTEVDDVLKNLVVYDDRGKVDEITLPGRAPASAIFRDAPFDQRALDSEPALLRALRGAEVRVETKEGVAITGRITSVVPEITALPSARGAVTRHRLTIVANGAVSTVILEDLTKLSFTDAALAQRLDAALGALIAQEERGYRTLVIHDAGEGERVVRVAYVVEAPIWKSTYRLMLPADPRAKEAPLQGFAIVEDQSGKDWRDIELTLVSGNPVAFHQALYESYYAKRPEAPVEVVGRVLPRLDLGIVPIGPSEPKEEVRARRALACGACSGRGGVAMAPGASPPAAPAPLVTPAATEAATQVVFRFGAPITIENGQTAVLPIVQTLIAIERLSLYQPETNARNPLASVRLTNNGTVGLPPGAVTVYERTADTGANAYAGDARLPTLPPGESRILSFAIDEKVRIDRREQDLQTLTLATIAGGVLTLIRTERRTTVYTIAGAAREPRTVILEVPRVEGFDLAAPKERVELAPDRYRIRVEVAAGATIRLPVTLERPLVERRSIAELGSEEIRAFVAAPDLPEATRAALAAVVAAQAVVAEKEAAVKALVEERDRIAQDQARIRENLKVVPAGDPLAARYLAELTAQEERLATLATQLAAARGEVDRARRALAETIRGLHIA